MSGFIVGEVEVVNEVSLAPSAVIHDGAVTAAGDLTINVNPFFYDLGGDKGKFKGILCTAVTDDDTNFVYLDAEASIKVSTVGYAENTDAVHIRLARVVTSGGIIVRIIHERAFLTCAGGGADGYVMFSDLDGYASDQTVSEHKAQFEEAIHHILVALDGYHPDVTGIEHYNQHSEAIQTILKDLDGYGDTSDLEEQVTDIQNALDGYHPDITGTEHYNQHSQAIQTILGDLDGYALLSIENQRWIDSSQQLQDIRTALDGYEGEGDVSKLSQTVDEHYNQHSQAIQTILGELDGYHPDVTGQEHFTQHSQAIQTILKNLDGYENEADLDDRVTIIQNSLDGYSGGPGPSNQDQVDDNSEAIQTILKDLDGYDAYVGNLASVQVCRTTDYTITSSYTDVPFDTTAVETDPSVIEHNNTNTERIDIKEDGLYMIAYGITIDVEENGMFSFRIQKNGTTEITSSKSTLWEVSSQESDYWPVSNTSTVELLGGDYVTFQVDGPAGVSTSHLENSRIHLNVTRLRGVKGEPGPQGPPGSSNVDDVEEAVQTILKDLDGYALLAVEDQRWVDSSQQRQDIRVALDGYTGGGTPGDQAVVQARRTTTYSLTTTFADITLDTTDVENDATVLDHDLATNTDRILIGETGPYRISYHADINVPPSSSTQDVLSRVRVNDTTVMSGSEALTQVFQDSSVPSALKNTIGKSFIVSLTSGDYISLQLKRTELFGSGAFTIAAGTIFTAVRLTGEKGDTGGGGGDVTAASNITDHAIVRGDGGTKGVKDSKGKINDAGNMVIGTGATVIDSDWDLFVQGTAGKNGIFICSGENEGDIAFRIKDQDGSFQILDVHADNGEIVMGHTYDAVKTGLGVVYGIDNRHTGSQGDINCGYGNYRVRGEIVPITEHQLYADQFDSPVNSDWAVNALAPAGADPDNAALTVRAFDDTTEEGVGFMMFIPAGATNMDFEYISRAKTAPASTKVVKHKLRYRQITHEGNPQTWQTYAFTDAMSVPATNDYTYATENATLSTIGLTADKLYQFEFTRDAPNAGDVLVGDWLLLGITIRWY